MAWKSVGFAVTFEFSRLFLPLGKGVKAGNSCL